MGCTIRPCICMSPLSSLISFHTYCSKKKNDRYLFSRHRRPLVQYPMGEVPSPNHQVCKEHMHTHTTRRWSSFHAWSSCVMYFLQLALFRHSCVHRCK